ncbi:D-hexose-6-phosphate mutarotase [Bordetella sp. BOR01]|uniref:D-hexose-6-phosphate mutarotase n=1 Tax=Bordetella sp. BOR01 TaxID=2854779 RepID=UPI001C459AAB|nr:D-hexose-6-phosphate mutarotase [Bordetella sp. BOR01]MBV7482098.1 D-hexose-6-phosphate mutarotase [Bordetella sp. BOR01]
MTGHALIEPANIGQLRGWRVRTPHGSALVARQGAQLLSYAPADGRPLIWLSEQAHLLPGVPVRGGIPVCWPWFAVYARNPAAVRDSVAAPPGAPSHGWVRQADWRLAGQHAEADEAELEFGFAALPGCAPGWRHHALLSMRMRFGQDIALALSVRNLGTQAFTTALALHTYFAVSDSRRVEIHGLQERNYLDMARHWERRRQAGPVILDGETDRLYLDTAAPVAVHDPGWRRKVCLRAAGSHSTVVWNPGADKAARLDDFANDAWQRMVCVETARVLDDALAVQPGDTATVSLSISVQACTA